MVLHHTLAHGGRIGIRHRDNCYKCVVSFLGFGAVIAFWLAKAHPDAKLIPADLDGEARTLEMLDYICGTVHPHGFTRQFRPANFTFSEADHPKSVELGKQNAAKYFDVLDRTWGGGTWALPSGYSVADAALFFVEYWAVRRSGLTLPPHLDAHLKAMLARPAVQRALTQEGLAL